MMELVLLYQLIRVCTCGNVIFSGGKGEKNKRREYHFHQRGFRE